MISQIKDTPLSNMFSCDVTVDIRGKVLTFKCSESAYQAFKSVTPEEFVDLNGYEAKKLGRTTKAIDGFFDGNNRIRIMWYILRCKFTQNEECRNYLLKTADEEIQAGNTWNDTYYGVCNGIGENWLGRILMQVRKEITPFKVIIAGSRHFEDYSIVENACNKILENKLCVEIVSGTCKGADLLGERYANEHSYAVKRFPADWNKYGKAAGPIRNKQMAEYADALIAFYDGKSRGTKSMISEATELGLNVRVINI